jgi:hypothetical protein
MRTLNINNMISFDVWKAIDVSTGLFNYCSDSERCARFHSRKIAVIRLNGGLLIQLLLTNPSKLAGICNTKKQRKSKEFITIYYKKNGKGKVRELKEL